MTVALHASSIGLPKCAGRVACKWLWPGATGDVGRTGGRTYATNVMGYGILCVINVAVEILSMCVPNIDLLHTNKLFVVYG